jgi:CRP/FNR family transcriptional regulator, anaerobic regulatory protein
MKGRISMKDDFEKFEFYSKLNDADKKLVRDNALKKQMACGQIMIGGSSRCNGVPMVLSGSLRLFRISDKGREVTLYRIGEGEMCIIAAVCLMGDLDYDFSIEAEEDCTLLIITPDIFKILFDRSPAFKSYVFNMLAQKLIMSMETIEMLIFISIEERILEYLKQNVNGSGEVKTTHEKMAIDLGTSREVITRQLNKMAEKGMVVIERGKIILKK